MSPGLRLSLRFAQLLALSVLGCGHGPAAAAPAEESDASDGTSDGGGPDGSTRSPDVDASHGETKLDASADASGDGSAATPPEPLQWQSAITTFDDGDVVIEKVTYLSEGLSIVGQVCRPNPSGKLGAGPFPVHVVNHGGFSGISDWNGGNCETTARRGWVVAESAYRGEDGSEGEVEVCLGEVTDVLRMTDIVRAQPYADPERVVMSGLSHGGCITLRALQRGAPVKLAIDIFGPTDWASAYASWKQALAEGTPLTAAYQGLVTALERGAGGTPDQVPEAYAARSPLHFVADLDKVRAPLLIVQGTADAYVPPAQACTLANAGAGFDRYHVTALGSVDTGAPPGCPDAATTWLPGPRPSTSWPKQRYLIVYDGVGHNFEGFATSYLISDMTAFLTARLPP